MFQRWAAWRAQCLRHARRYVADEAEAQDVVQEALIRAWRHRGRCRTPSAPLPWLLAITRNEALRHRAAARSVSLDELEEPADLVAAEEIGRAGGRVDLARALGRLSARERRLLGLRCVLDMTYADLADHLGIPESTARVRVHRARLRLRALLAN